MYGMLLTFSITIMADGQNITCVIFICSQAAHVEAYTPVIVYTLVCVNRISVSNLTKLRCTYVCVMFEL